MTPSKNALSVRFKILITVALSILVLGAAIFAISSLTLRKSYRDIENEAMTQDLRRATDALKEFSGQQLIKLSDWAAWDEAYEYARDRDPVWAADTVYATGLANLDINAMMFSEPKGAQILLMAVDIQKRIEVPKTDIERYFTEHPDLITFDSLAGKTEGIAMLPQGPLIIVSLPLRTSEGKGPSTGAITFARYLDADKLADFSSITHLALALYQVDDPAMPLDVARAKARLSVGAANVIEPQSEDVIAGYTFIRDLYDKPILILRVETPRPIYEQGNITLGLYLLLGAVALVLFGIIVVFALDLLVIRRFERLSRDVEKINEEHDLSRKLTTGEPDEIGRLAGKVNQMLSWLKEAREGEAASRREALNLLSELKAEKEQADEMKEILAIKKGKSTA